MKQAINHVSGAPQPVGPYSQAVRVGQFLFLAGQTGADPATGKIEGDVKAQTERAMESVGAILASQGLDFSHVVKSLVFLTDMNDLATVNEIYGRRFKGDRPAKSCVAVASLPKGGKVEIDVVAAFPS